MAFTRSRRFSRRQSSRKSSALVPVSSRQAEFNLARRVALLSRRTRGLTPEVKFNDISLASTNITDTAGVAILLNGVAQGLTNVGRVGDFIRCKSVWVQAVVSTAASSITQTPIPNWSIRMYIVIDRQQLSGTAPVLADVVDQPSLPNNQVINNATGIKRFSILWDSGPRSVGSMMDTTTTGVTLQWAQPTRSFRFAKKIFLKGLQTEFNSTTAASIQKNGLYLLISTNITTDTLDVDGTSRVEFTDA